MEEEKKLGLPSVVSTSVGLIVATSCLMGLGQGSGKLGIGFIIPMILVCVVNICTGFCIAELNALMPNLTGGLAQYTLAGMGPFVTLVTMVGGYLVCQSMAGSIESAMFGNAINAVFDTGVPARVFSILMILLLMVANLMGVDIFAKIQNIVVYGLIFSLVCMGVIGIFDLGTGEVVVQKMNLATSASDYFSMLGLAFFLFIGCEFVIPLSANVKNARRNIPLGMALSLLIILVMQSLVVVGMGHYTKWEDLAASASPHILYGQSLLGYAGSIWMIVVSAFAVISTVNSAISFLSYTCAGMAKIGLLPEVFLKRNKRGAYYVGVLGFGSIFILINATGLSTSDSLSFLILVSNVFWMISYVVSCTNVLIFRRKLPKAPRTFRAPLGPVIPVVGMLGSIFMIWNIDGDPAVRNRIFLIDGIVFLAVSVYAVIWCKFKMKKPLFRAFPIHEVMAMENPLYIEEHKKYKAEHGMKAGPVKKWALHHSTRRALHMKYEKGKTGGTGR